MNEAAGRPLDGARVLVAGVANADSIAWGCARAFHELGAEVALTYLNDKALPHVAPLAEAIGAPILMPLDVEDDKQAEALFARIGEAWGSPDAMVHSIAFAPKADLRAGCWPRRRPVSRAPWISRATPSCAWPVARCR